MNQIRLLHTPDCHAYHQALDELEAALREVDLPVRMEIVVITSEVQAKRYRFFGSPAIHIDGRDVDPLAANATQYHAQACRSYFWQGKSYDFPPKEMILRALKGR
jgi:hypothetical protein